MPPKDAWNKHRCLTLVVNCALGRLHWGIWEFQPVVQHFSCCQQLADATSVTCALWHGTCPQHAQQLRTARQHSIVSRLCNQTCWLEGQSSRGVWQAADSPARFYSCCIRLVVCRRCQPSTWVWIVGRLGLMYP